MQKIDIVWIFLEGYLDVPSDMWSQWLAEVTKSMEQIPSSDVNSSKYEETLRCLWDQNAHCIIHNSPLPHRIMSQMNPLYTYLAIFL
jgi:hypothetical protein